MPNGGLGHCGTCKFNSKNDGKKGYPEIEKEGDAYCVIRKFKIPKPLWTYCDNHNQDEKTKPIGPVYIIDSHPYEKKVWKPEADK